MNQSVIFHILPNFPFVFRLIISLALIAGGIIWQLLTGLATPGWILLLLASIFLMYKGVDIRVVKNSIFHAADWQKITREQVQQIVDTNQKLYKWDTSVFESSGCLGSVILILIIGVSFCLIYFSLSNIYLMCIGMDILVLFLPQFLSGMKRFDMLAKPVLYAQKILEAATKFEMMYPNSKIEYLVLLGTKKDTEVAVPKEVKFKVTFPQDSPDFLGMYGQLSINNVGSTMYPYFYTVQVYKQGFGLKKKMGSIQMTDKNVIKEYTEDSGVEVMVIRQRTTQKTGYYTKAKDVERILLESVRAYELLN